MNIELKTTRPINLGIVAVGKIVRDQHLPAIEKNSNLNLIATASRNASLNGVPSFKTIEQMIESKPNLDAVALCMPPQYRYEAAKFALNKEMHVLLEKPPGATVCEVDQLAQLATMQGVSLFTSWHSRYGAGVEQAKKILADRVVKSITIDWREDVRKWHPGQSWIWQAGGLGVFDPGINALSILNYVITESVRVSHANLFFPENKLAPIASTMSMTTASGVSLEVNFDWREEGQEVWNIQFELEDGELLISEGGASVSINGEQIQPTGKNEYDGIYRRFVEIIDNGVSDVDLTPLKLTADAFLLGERKLVSAFEE